MRIKSKVKDYDLSFVRDVFQERELLEEAAGKDGRRFSLIDANVFRLYRRKLASLLGRHHRIVVPASEKSKMLPFVATVYKRLIDAGMTRKDCIVTFGGGILQDVSGFVASTLYRGVRWVFVPTTLLSQADSCIGSKTSLNFDNGKNQLGTFYPPDRILVDPSFNATLPESFFRSGVGEIIKVHLMAGRAAFDSLRAHALSGGLRKPAVLGALIRRSLEIKRSFFSGDEFDRGRRNLLNYGHTLGHALESATDFAISHGEAVIVGMGFANALSRRRGLMGAKDHAEIETLLAGFYPAFDLASVRARRLVAFAKKDKKRTGSRLSMVLLGSPGRLRKFDDVAEGEFRAAFQAFSKAYPKR